MKLRTISKKRPTKKERITRIYASQIIEYSGQFVISAHVRLATGEKTSVCLTDKSGHAHWKTREHAEEVLRWYNGKMAARLARRPTLGRLLCAVGLHLYRHRTNDGHLEHICERCGKAERRFFFAWTDGADAGKKKPREERKRRSFALWCGGNPRRGH